MRRREFIILLGGNALGCSLKALAQQPAMPVIGYLNAGASAPSGYFVTAFRQGLNETGFVRGTKCGDRVSLSGRSLRAAAGACCRTSSATRSAFFVATGSPSAGLAAKAATTSIPIVFFERHQPG